MSACLISDLHLQADRSDLTDAFDTFIKNTASSFDSLYILGDLFEAWIGDDFEDEFIISIKKILKDLSSSGTKLYLMHGNRDFLIGENFCNSIGASLLKDPSIVEICNKNILLMHGDSLCIDDIDYQSFRSVVRDESWINEFLSKSINERVQLAKNLRDVSKTENKDKSFEIMDVNKMAVNQAFQDNNSSLLVHGHTHRPKIHEETYGKRIVLGDWDKKLWYLKITNEDMKLLEQNI
jgi:UDP-2,3-diacylglucosamine hydrolase